MRTTSAMLALALFASIGSAPAWAQDVSALAGTWTLDPTTRGGRHLLAGMPTVGPIASTLVIDVSPSRVLIQKGGTVLDREAYRLDGTETDVGGGRKGTAAVTDGTLVLTIRRMRPDGGTNVFKDRYRASGGVLTIGRELSVIQADGTTRDDILSYAHAVVYRKR